MVPEGSIKSLREASSRQSSGVRLRTSRVVSAQTITSKPAVMNTSECRLPAASRERIERMAFASRRRDSGESERP